VKNGLSLQVTNINWVFFVKKVLIKIFGRKRQEVTSQYRILRNEELHNCCSSPDIIKVMTSRRVRWVKHVAYMGRVRNACKILVG
jgi:hypothetical protein